METQNINITQAPKGGCIGLNGESYKGGQFLPTSEATVKGRYTVNAKKFNPSKKQEVAPYKWEVPPPIPVDDAYAKSLFCCIRDFMDWAHFDETGSERIHASGYDYITNETEESLIKEMLAHYRMGCIWIYYSCIDDSIEAYALA